MKIDANTEFGQRVARRLETEPIIWLTTVAADGAPYPRPVWFLWDGATFLIYSRPNTFKLRHIQQRPIVALNLDGDGLGGNIIVITGRAKVDPNAPPANVVPAYIEKYTSGLKRINMTADQFAQVYSTAIRITPEKLRGH